MFGPWAKGQNGLERLFHYSRLPYDLKVIKGPDLPPPVLLINSKKRKRKEWNADRQKKRARGEEIPEYPGFKCSYCKTVGHKDIAKHTKTCPKFKQYKMNSVRVPKSKNTKA